MTTDPGPPAGASYAPPPGPPPSAVQRDETVAWGFGTAASALAIFLFGQLLVSTIAIFAVVLWRGLPAHPDAGVALEQALRDLPTSWTLAAAIAGQVAALAAVAWLLRRRDVDLRGLGVLPVSGAHLVRGFGLGFVALIGTVLVTAALQSALGIDDPTTQSLVEVVGDATVTTILVLVASVAVAPVLEEVVFRGVLLGPMVDRLGETVGVVLNGLVFAVVHVELLAGGLAGVPSMVALALLGTLLAWSARRWRSLVVPIATHASFNGITLAIVIATESSRL